MEHTTQRYVVGEFLRLVDGSMAEPVKKMAEVSSNDGNVGWACEAYDSASLESFYGQPVVPWQSQSKR